MRLWKPKLSLKRALLFWLGLSVLLAWQRENAATCYYRMMGMPAFRLVENRVQFEKVLKHERAALFVGPNWSTSSQLAEAKFRDLAEQSRAGWSRIKFYKIDYTDGIPADLGFEPWIWEQETKSDRWRHGYGAVFLICHGEAIETIDELQLLKKGFEAKNLMRKFREQGSGARTKKPH